MVHTYSLNGYKIAIDGNSGNIHVLDDITFDMLKDEDDMPSLVKAQEKLKDKYDSIVTGSHEMFVGKIEYVHADENLIDSEGNIDFSQINFI